MLVPPRPPKCEICKQYYPANKVPGFGGMVHERCRRVLETAANRVGGDAGQFWQEMRNA